MGAFLDPLIGSGENIVSMLGVLVFVTTTLVAFAVMGTVRSRTEVRRRAATISVGFDDADGAGLRQSSVKAVQRLVDYTNKHYATLDAANLKLLRRRLVQAGIFDPRAVGFFFVIRTALALGIGAILFVGVPAFLESEGALLALIAGAGGIAGYVGPSLYLDRRIKARQQEYRVGFPDFMDLLVVCADAGLAMEAALERVGRELADSYPALATNIHMTNLEIRAGRTLSEALEHFGDRLGLEEVRAFAMLIQQSDELGSSITEALRVYSEDMRHKRLSRAEEKAYSLPARLSLPMMICIFPVLFVVILLPVVVRIKMGAY